MNFGGDTIQPRTASIPSMIKILSNSILGVLRPLGVFPGVKIKRAMET